MGAKKITKKKGGKKKKAAKKPKKKKAKKIKRGSFRRVWSGTVQTSKGGLTKDKLTKNKAGKVVSKKGHAQGLKAYKRISGWVNAVSKEAAQAQGLRSHQEGHRVLQVGAQALREVSAGPLHGMSSCITNPDSVRKK